jgi:hypothetical protein
VGHRHPRTIERVLDRAARSTDAVRDGRRVEVIAGLGDEDGVPVLDGTGCVEKGTKSRGTAGRVANGQAGMLFG